MGSIRFPGENVYVKTNEFQEWDSERVEPILLAKNEDVDFLVDKEMGWNFPDTSIVPNTSLSTPEKKKFDSLLAEYKDVFASSIFDLGACTLLDFRIELLDKTPIYTPPYRASEETRKFLQKEMNQLLKAGIIRQSNSEYSAPVIVIDKKDGSKRICVDYRKLNTITVTEKWPVSLPNDIFEDISSSQIFSTMDLKSGYYQIKMASYSIKYTAFSTPDGHYEFIVLPFGLKNAPAVFCRMMHMLLANLPPIKWFMDDIVIHSTNVESHLTQLRRFFNRLREVNIKLNAEKCTWLGNKIKLLGHVVSNGEIQMDHGKLSAIRDRLSPVNVKQVQQFLGLCNYYRIFIKDFASISKPLYGLLAKDCLE